MVNLERGSLQKEVVIKSKHSKGWILWRKVVKKKPMNDRLRFENYLYELYNKLEIDLNRINLDRFKQVNILKPFGSIIAQTTDTISEEKPFLPIFISESISDFYYQKWVKNGVVFIPKRNLV
jgi:hypothetical protein